ncbi:MAG: (4Fe-4S)-binding protein, partial [Candidatus Korarchaeota archaeon]|nr:(4Fe-4S)-binding protein [Candidatus Korarchaeota archaeon]
MKQIAVVSGKGGTGKTTITASFAALAHDIVIADCDVDAPDLHLLLHPQIIETQEFKSSKLAVVDETKCVECGLCRDACRFDAINKDFQVDPFLCEGCGVCVVVCTEEAISLKERISGYAFISKTKYGTMSHARLNPGEANSGKLVTLVRHNARQIAEKENRHLILIDGPPGIGCPVIASVSGVDAGLAVAEPTMSGIHDLERALQLLNHFHVTPFVCINMYDINRNNTERIVKFCEKNKLEVAGKFPFDPIVTEAMVAGETVVEHSPDS